MRSKRENNDDDGDGNVDDDRGLGDGIRDAATGDTGVQGNGDAGDNGEEEEAGEEQLAERSSRGSDDACRGRRRPAVITVIRLTSAPAAAGSR